MKELELIFSDVCKCLSCWQTIIFIQWVNNDPKHLKTRKAQPEVAAGKRTQINSQKKKGKQWSKNTTQKTEDRATWTPLKTGGELGCSKKSSTKPSVEVSIRKLVDC